MSADFIFDSWDSLISGNQIYKSKYSGSQVDSAETIELEEI